MTNHKATAPAAAQIGATSRQRPLFSPSNAVPGGSEYPVTQQPVEFLQSLHLCSRCRRSSGCKQRIPAVHRAPGAETQNQITSPDQFEAGVMATTTQEGGTSAEGRASFLNGMSSTFGRSPQQHK